MNEKKIDELIKSIEDAENELLSELKKGAESVKCDFSEQKVPLFKYITSAKPSFIATAPIIYSMIVPAVIMDLFVTIYQNICFRVYDIPMVKREDYIVFDRHRLAYLNTLQKLNCLYCAYFNGLIAYVREIASKTEQFWCPIRHKSAIRYPHRRYWRFLRYADAEALKERWMKLREELKSESE